jgi:hypothetical protein
MNSDECKIYTRMVTFYEIFVVRTFSMSFELKKKIDIKIFGSQQSMCGAACAYSLLALAAHQ